MSLEIRVLLGRCGLSCALGCHVEINHSQIDNDYINFFFFLKVGQRSSKFNYTAIMESSRIFVKNLPPNANEEDLRKHFSTKGTITSLKIISERRLAFIGYKDPQEAAKAAKFYNRSYIRLSKLSVELARPLGSVPNKKINTQGKSNRPDEKSQENLVASKKRKRDDELREEEPSTEVPPSKTRAIKPESSEKSKLSKEEAQPMNSAIENDEWMRARTNRLLDLVEPDEIRLEPTPDDSTPDFPEDQVSSAVTIQKDEASPATTLELRPDEPAHENAVEKKIRETGRLYLRNLSYTTSEADLRETFGAFGTIEEVRYSIFTCNFLLPSMMNPMIGTSDAIWRDEIPWANILVDASFLNLGPTVPVYSFENLLPTY